MKTHGFSVSPTKFLGIYIKTIKSHLQTSEISGGTNTPSPHPPYPASLWTCFVPLRFPGFGSPSLVAGLTARGSQNDGPCKRWTPAWDMAIIWVSMLDFWGYNPIYNYRLKKRFLTDFPQLFSWYPLEVQKMDQTFCFLGAGLLFTVWNWCGALVFVFGNVSGIIYIYMNIYIYNTLLVPFSWNSPKQAEDVLFLSLVWANDDKKIPNLNEGDSGGNVLPKPPFWCLFLQWEISLSWEWLMFGVFLRQPQFVNG